MGIIQNITQATIKTKLGAATTSVDGYLTSTDWNTFNNKVPTTITVAGHALTGNVTVVPADINHIFEIVDGTTSSITAGNYTAVDGIAHQGGDTYWNQANQYFTNLPVGKYLLIAGVAGGTQSAVSQVTGLRDLYNGGFTSTQNISGTKCVFSRIVTIASTSDTLSIQINIPVTSTVVVKMFLFQL